MSTETKALPADPVVEWLERVRDYPGTTRESRELASLALDRLTGADRPDFAAVIYELRQDMGTWRVGAAGTVVADRPSATTWPGQGPEDLRYYGGYLVGESLNRKAAIVAARLPQLLDVASETPVGRAVLEEIARDLLAPPRQRTPISDRFDAAQRVSALADDFRCSEFLGAADILGWLAAALILCRTAELNAVVGEFMRREQERRT